MHEIAQAPDLPAEGAAYRAARTTRHLSLDDASRSTRLRLPFLDAIERGDLARYPSHVYAAGHIRIYARFLGLDPQPYLKAIEPVEAASPVATAGRAPMTISPGRARNPTPFVVLVALIVLSAYLVNQYLTFLSSADQVPLAATAPSLMIATPIPFSAATVVGPGVAPTATVDLRPPAVLSVPTTAPTSLPTPTVRPTPAASTGVLVETSTTGRVWIQIETDSRVVFSGILNAGDQRSWTASEKLLLWAGDAGNVSVRYNGKDLGRLGAPGQVLKVTWTSTS